MTLTRLAFERWLPWGVVLQVDKSMCLLECRTGSVAASSAELRACVGMELYQVDDTPVCNLREVSALIDDAATVTLHFAPYGDEL